MDFAGAKSLILGDLAGGLGLLEMAWMGMLGAFCNYAGGSPLWGVLIIAFCTHVVRLKQLLQLMLLWFAIWMHKIAGLQKRQKL